MITEARAARAWRAVRVWEAVTYGARTVREVQEALALKSPSTAHAWMRDAQAARLVDWAPGLHRSLHATLIVVEPRKAEQ